MSISALKRAALLPVLLCALAPSAPQAQTGPKSRSASLPSLRSALPNYSPETLAIFVGTGFLPNEVVAMQILMADGTLPSSAGHEPWSVVVGASGSFTTSWLVSPNSFGSELIVTANGNASGRHSRTSFSNNHDCGTGVVTSVTGVGGACSAFTPAQGNGPDNYEVQEGGTYTMTIEGVTECSGDTITVFVQSSSSGNFCFNAVGGSGTYVGTFTMPSPACNTMPVSYKCGADATCNHPGSLGASGPNSGCGGVHLRTSIFDGGCNLQGEDEDCNPPPAEGACCLTDGSCVEATEAECAAQGGTYGGDGSSCVNVSCPQPAGACCLADGSCVEVTEEDCLAQGGTFNGDGSTCMNANCPQPTGSCCLVDGSCVVVTADECATMGGTYNGDNSSCMDANCPTPAGACCLADGSCVQVTAADCAAQGGSYGGDGSLCKDTDCPQPTGACCLVDGSCVVATADDCVAQGGAYQGDNSDCGSANCPQPPGACCLMDGTCVEVTEADCTALGGTFSGVLTQCASANCPQPVGACCLVDDTCVLFTEEDCAAVGGNYFGDGSSCDDADCEADNPVCYKLDFESDDSGNPMVHGTKVDSEFDCNGSGFPVAITSVVSASGQDTAAILDSNVGPAMQDPDLLVGLGNILILQNDSNLTQCPPNSGVYCSHNDDNNGGSLSFDFCVPIIPSAITMIDIDGSDPASSVVLTDVNGKTRTYTIPGNWTGDRVINFPQPGWQVLNLTTLANQPGFASTATASEQAGYNPNAVVSIDVVLGGSGAVDDLCWCQ
jgi:hypothetical protein